MEKLRFWICLSSSPIRQRQLLRMVGGTHVFVLIPASFQWVPRTASTLANGDTHNFTTADGGVVEPALKQWILLSQGAGRVQTFGASVPGLTSTAVLNFRGADCRGQKARGAFARVGHRVSIAGRFCRADYHHSSVHMDLYLLTVTAVPRSLRCSLVSWSFTSSSPSVCGTPVAAKFSVP